MYPHKMMKYTDLTLESDGLCYYPDTMYSNYLCTLHVDHLSMCGIPNKPLPIYGLVVDNLKF